jgi:hypothetical protein
MMGSFGRQAYFIAPKIDVDYLRKTKLDLIPIETDGSFFFEQFREHHNSSHNCIIDDDAFDDCEALLYNVNELHEMTADEYLSNRRPLLILALSYQDGLQDSLMRIKDRRKSGEYFSAHHVQNLIARYENRIREYRKRADYWNACYCRGYQNGLIYLISGGGTPIPPPVELLFNETIDTMSKIRRFSTKNLPVRVRNHVERIFKSLGDEPLVPEHLPYV